jgi:S-disulfanyl-L-cysteine oxidoreductase SoxD
MSLVRAPIAAALLVLAVGPARAQEPADSTGPDLATRGAYSADQARRGQSIYARHCTSCHAATAYTGVAFRRAWGGRSVFELWELIRTTMPNDTPGRLSGQEYADIVAYLLRLNGFPAGPDPLPPDPERLQRLTISHPPRPGN